MLKPYFDSNNSQKILNFLALNSGEFFYEREIAKKLNLNPSSVFVAMKQLVKDNCLEKEIKGKMCFYKLNDNYYQTKEIKTLAILLHIEKLIEKLKPLSDKIVLFGSCADGTYSKDSDIDLFIESNKKNEIYDVIEKFLRSTGELKKIQAIVRNAKEILSQKDSVFTNEVAKGKILYERETNEEIL